MLKFAAHTISYVLHPLLMPTYLFGIVGYLSPVIFQYGQWLAYIILMVFVLTAVLPALNLALFRMVGTIQNLHMPTRRERIAPFLFITLLYIGVTALTYFKVPIPIVVKLMVVSTLLVAAVSASVFFIKISAHAVGIAGLTGILLALAAFYSVNSLMLPAIGSVMLSGLVMSGRLALNAHTIQEITWGGVLGFAIGFGGVLMLF